MEHVSRNLRVVSACTVVSRVLGMVRDAVMAATFGAGPVLDAFTLAFRIPNLARSVLGEGAVATAFLPVLVRELETGGKPAASRISTALFILLASGLCGVVGIAELALWWWGEFAPALSHEAELLRRLTAILLPYVILICLAAQVSTLLHATREFLWPALVPSVLNLLWLLSLWCVVPWWSDPTAQVTAMSACVVLAGGVQLLFLLPAILHHGYRPARDWWNAVGQATEVFRHVAPVLVALSITQLNSIFSSVVAWGLSKPTAGADAIAWLGGVPYPLTSGTTSALYFAQRLYQFPLGVFGVALGTVLYPLLAAHAQRGDWARLRADFSLGLRLVAAIGLPASAGLVLLADPLATGFFRYGRFDAEAARQTAQMIAAYGAAVWAFCGLLIVQRGFYALGDRITPLYVGMGAFALNLVLNVTVIWWLGGVGLAVSSSVVSMAQCVVTGWLLQRRIGGIEWPSVSATVGKTLLATVFMCVVGYAVLFGLAAWPGLTGRALRIVAPLSASLIVFFAVSALIRLREPWDLLRRSRTSAPVLDAPVADL